MFGLEESSRGFGGRRRLCNFSRIASAAMIIALNAALMPTQATARQAGLDPATEAITAMRLGLISSLLQMVTTADRIAARSILKDAYDRLQAGDLAEAAGLFERGLDLDPGAPLAKLWLAETYRRQGQATHASGQRALADALAAMTDNAKVAELRTDLLETNPWAVLKTDDPRPPHSFTSGRYLRLWRSKLESLK